jgi:hypothetical protein
MKLGTTVLTSFAIGFIFAFVGFFLKVNHIDSADSWLLVSIISSIVFVVSALYEVRTSTRIEHTEKTMWTIAFLFFSGIAGLVYVFMARRRIAAI